MSFKMTLKFLLFATMAFGSGYLVEVEAADSPWTSGNRIAISADGNPDADADDVGATPFTLAMLAKAGLQDNLVHYDFNNFLEYKKINAGSNRMWLSAMGGQNRWGFDTSRFFDAAIDPDGAVAHLTAEINKSTAGDPLYLIAAGPMELIYRALEAANSSARQHVKIVSHHDYNEYFKPRLWQRNWNDVQVLVPGITRLRIADQNGGGLKGTADSDFSWLQAHADPNLNWVYDRIVAGKPDVSDAGMTAWLIGINGTDEVVTIPEMQTWFGAALIPGNGGSQSTPAAPAGVEPVVVPPTTESIFEEVGGKIVIEAESVPLTDNWHLLTTDTHAPGLGYSGDGYVRWIPSWIGKIDHQHQGVLIYKLRITNPGNYRMALRSSHTGAPERDKWNDCWTVMGLNPVNPYGITRKTYHSITQAMFDEGTGFTWHTTHDNYGSVAGTDGEFSQPLYNLEEGDHYFFICGRSGGFRIDKIHFFLEGVSGFKSDSEPQTPILPGDLEPPVEPGIPAQMSFNGSNVILNITNGAASSWFTLLSKTNLVDVAWTTNQISLSIDGAGRGSVTNPMTAPYEFYKLIESGAPPAPQPPYTTSFESPAYSAGNLTGQDGWIAQTQWQADGAGSIANTSGAWIRAHNTDVLGTTAIGEAMSIISTFTLGTYSTPSADIAGWEEGIFVQAMSHENGQQAWDAQLSAGLFYNVGTGNVELRASEGSLISGTASTVIGAAATLGGTTYTLETVYTKTADDTWTVVATLTQGGTPYSISYTASAGVDLDTDSDGGGVLGGFLALPCSGGSSGVATAPFGSTTVTDYTIEVFIP
ncbi:hypothetical protein P4B35_17955 [Pontiellaceae bacterium B12227]|nr:hypothetical protein [Pontiellaceae bacterium B12227]